MTLATLVLLIVCQAPADRGWVHPFDFPQPAEAPSEVNAVVEIPAGGFVKYELDRETGHPVVDRFQSMAVAYPANYGCFSQTLSGDGDPLDVLVYTRGPLAPGSIIRVRPIGILKTTDGGESDDKVIAVPTSYVDPTYDGIDDISKLPPIELDRLREFFASYKRIPAGRKVVEIHGFEDAASARAAFQAARQRYDESPRASRTVSASLGR